jgi:LysM repeat protein
MNDIDHLLHDAFDSVRVPGDIRPQLADVRTRARRMHRRRTSGMVGALAVVGAAGVGLQSLRHDARAALTPGDGGVDLGLGNDATTGGPTTSIDCGIAIAPTTIGVDTVTTIAYYTVQQGDTPSGVAEKVGVSLEELRAANASNATFEAFVVGGTIVVPLSPPPTSLPDWDTLLDGNGLAQCAPDIHATESTVELPTVPTVTNAAGDTALATTTTYFGQGAATTTGG